MAYLDYEGLQRFWEKIKARPTPVNEGGTGATTAAQARVNLGVDISAETIQMFEDAGYPIE